MIVADKFALELICSVMNHELCCKGILVLCKVESDCILLQVQHGI
jgi:hypothetical protein